MILTATDPNNRVDPLADILSNGVGILGNAIQNAISLGKGRADLQNQQGGQFFDLLRQEEATRNRKFEFAVGQANTNRAFDRGVLESDRTFQRGILTSDRAFNRGVLESDRAFNYGKARDAVADTRAGRDFALRSFTAGTNAALALNADSRAASAESRAAAGADLLNTERALDIAGKSLAISDQNEANQRRDAALARTNNLFQQSDAGFIAKPETSSVTLQDYVANHAGIKDDRIQGAVNAARVEIDRRTKATTQDQLAPEVSALRKEITDLNAQLAAGKKEDKAPLSRQITDRQKRLDEIITQFPGLASKTGLTPGAETSLNSLLKNLGLTPKK